MRSVPSTVVVVVAVAVAAAAAAAAAIVGPASSSSSSSSSSPPPSIRSVEGSPPRRPPPRSKSNVPPRTTTPSSPSPSVAAFVSRAGIGGVAAAAPIIRGGGVVVRRRPSAADRSSPPRATPSPATRFGGEGRGVGGGGGAVASPGNGRPPPRVDGRRSRRSSSRTSTIDDTDASVATASASSPTKVAHFNNAGASPSPPPVLRTVREHLDLETAVGGYAAAEIVSSRSDGVYDSVARLLGCGDVDERGGGGGGRDEIALVESATVGWTRIFYSIVESVAAADDAAGGGGEGGTERVMLVSEAEYAANVVAAVKFAKTRNANADVGGRWRVLPIPSSSVVDPDGNRRSTGVVDVDALEAMLSGRSSVLDSKSIVLVCVTHVPTNSGVVNPIEKIGELVERYNDGTTIDVDADGGERSPRTRELPTPSQAAATESSTTGTATTTTTTVPQILYLVDACQSAGQIPLNVHEIRCHALTGTGRKYLRGPRGTGFLYVRRDVADALTPSHLDHFCAPVITLDGLDDNEMGEGCEGGGIGGIESALRFGYRPGAKRFEFWESNASNRLGLGEAMRCAMEDVPGGIEGIYRRCRDLGEELRGRLRAMDGVSVYHDAVSDVDGEESIGTERCGIVTFSVEGVDAKAVKDFLWSTETAGAEGDPDGAEGQSKMTTATTTRTRFGVSVVPATSTPLDSAKTKVGDLVRASLTYANTVEEIESFCEKLRRCIADSEFG